MYKELLGYLIGSFPTGYLLTKFFSNIDIRKCGSGSIGATNVLRSNNSSKLIAAITLLIDVSKGALVAYYFSNSVYALICCLLGHVFPIWLKGHGGKGVATFTGIILVTTPVNAIISIISWIITLSISRISSLASLSLVTTYLILTVVTNNNNLFFAIFSFIFIGITHKGNIMRLINRSEPKIKKYGKN